MSGNVTLSMGAAAMDPVSTGVLLALAGGAGGEVGRQAWAGLSALVRRPFRRDVPAGEPAEVVEPAGSGEAELAALERGPADQGRAQKVAAVLAARAAVDRGFAARLPSWWGRARVLPIGEGDVSNKISGGVFFGIVIQGRDQNISSGARPASPADGPGSSPQE